MRVLVADDDPTTLFLVRDTLRRFGYEVETASDGLAAWNKLKDAEIPIVVTDLDMPVEDGLTLCRRIRAAAFSHYTYVVLLTQHSARKNLLEGMSAGADDFVSKPLDPEQLRVRLIVAQRIVTLERELRELNKKLTTLNQGLEVLSRVDPLTGAGNRNAFQEQIELTHANALRTGHSYGVVVCDLDRFKQVNDRFGHQRGDQVLAEAVAEIRSIVRTGDSLFRYGGDEVVLIIPNAGLENVARVAERICDGIRAAAFNAELEPSLQITASFGVAAYPESCGEGSHWAELFGLADEAMYVAKRRGGDGLERAPYQGEGTDQEQGRLAFAEGSPPKLTAA
ncbi:MAG: diguanylate cyclase [Acidobacteria bacterium]|nr:diguanylate cyclase [Acidobacteriota bacterium]MDA1234365.1 diguanylate cyclase [Acidobacteriota bacterium]